MPLLEKFKDLTTGTKLRTILSSLLVALLIPITLFANTQSWELRRKAAEEPEPTPESEQATEPEYAPGEVLVKFRQGVEIKAPEKEQQPFSVEALETESSTKPLADFLKQHSVTQLEKVFKGASDPQTELNKFKQKFPQRKINEEELLKIDLSRTYKLTFDNEVDIPTKVQELSQNPNIEYAEPNYIFKTQLIPNDPYYLDSYPDNVVSECRSPGWNPSYDCQWNLKKIGMEGAWDVATGSGSILVAVVDTGVYYEHSELGGCSLEQVSNGQCPRIAPGYDFVNNDNDPFDDNGHGTHVTGIITSETNNAAAIAGVSWQTTIIPVKVLNSRGVGGMSTLAEGIYFATNSGARVINMSLGLEEPTSSISVTLKLALDYAYVGDVLLVVAAGNSNADVAEGFWPAGYRYVMSVAASTYEDAKASYSNYGKEIDVAAPGGEIPDIFSLRPSSRGRCCWRLAGTSQAAPHVSGLAALLLGVNSNLRHEEVRSIIKASADRITGLEWAFGAGRINAQRTLQNANQTTLMTLITAPLQDQPVENGVVIKGVVRSPHPAVDGLYRVRVREKSDEPPEVGWRDDGITLLQAGDPNSTYASGELAVWDAANYTQGEWTIRLDASLSGGGEDKIDVVLIKIENLRDGWPRRISGNPPNPNGPTVADLDGDGKLEVTVGSGDGHIYMFKENGEEVSGWPVKISSNCTRNDCNEASHSPAVGKLYKDSDEKYVVAATVLGGDADDPHLFVLRANGQVDPRFPLAIRNPRRIEGGVINHVNRGVASPPILEDLDNDGYLEIIATTEGEDYQPYFGSWSRIHVFKFYSDLNTWGEADGWPFEIIGNIKSLAVGNIDNSADESKEIAAFLQGYEDTSAKIYVFAVSNASLPGWPKDLDEGAYASSIALANLDSSEDLEIVADSDCFSLSKLYVFKSTGENYSPSWPQAHRDCFSSPAVFNYQSRPLLAYRATSLSLGNSQNKLYLYNPNLENPLVGEVSLSDVGGIITFNPVAGDYFDGLQNQKMIVSKTLSTDPFGRLYLSLTFISPDGSSLLESPRQIGAGGYSDVWDRTTPFIADLANNGQTSVGYIFQDRVYVLNVDANGTNKVYDWPQYLHDERHTGAYTPPEEEPTCTPGSLLEGDTNCDCVVNIFDLVRVGTNYGKTENNPGWDPLADIVADGRINIFDLVKVGVNYGRTCP